MRHRNLRKYLFTGFALVNLVCWVGLAGVMGLLATREVDLGVETLLRRAQATVVAVWDRQADSSPQVSRVEAAGAVVIMPSPSPTLEPVTAVSPSSLPATQGVSPTAALTAPAGPTSGAGTDPADMAPQPPSPTATATPRQPGPAAAQPGSQAVSDAMPSQPVATWPTPTTLPGMSHVPGASTRAPDTLPLLLADPAFGDLSLLNAEMDRSASGRPVQIRYREQALNHEIARIVENNPALPYRDVVVDLNCDRIVVSGKATVLGVEIDASVEGTLSVRDCRPYFDVESVSVEALASTGFINARVADMLEEAMAWYPADYALCLEQIVLEEDKASIYGHRR